MNRDKDQRVIKGFRQSRSLVKTNKIQQKNKGQYPHDKTLRFGRRHGVYASRFRHRALARTKRGDANPYRRPQLSNHPPSSCRSEQGRRRVSFLFPACGHNPHLRHAQEHGHGAPVARSHLLHRPQVNMSGQPKAAAGVQGVLAGSVSCTTRR